MKGEQRSDERGTRIRDRIVWVLKISLIVTFYFTAGVLIILLVIGD